VVVNKAGGAGAEGFLDLKNARPDGHKIVITLSNLFTTPLATGVPFNWKDLTPVTMLALDEFVLWVNAESGIKSTQDFVKALKAGAAGLVDHHDGLRRQLVLGHHALDEARHLVGPAAGACRHDELDRLAGRPLGAGR
jgi:tripartite-type tricarboxylate transporter receptor subunit TctC